MAKRRRRSGASKSILMLFLVAVAIVALVVYLTRGAKTGVTSTATPSVVISEVMTSNKGTVPDENGKFPDWIELYNPGDKAVDIGGFGLSDDLLSAAKWTFPSGTVLEPHGYALVFCSGDATEGRMHAAFKLSSSDDVILSSVSGNVIDSVSLRSVASGSTLSRDPNNMTNWIETKPSPGYPNTDEGAASYVATLTVSAGESIGVTINEIMPSNASTVAGPLGNYCDWFELYNQNSKAVDLSGFGVSDDPSQPMKYVLPAGTTIEGYSVLVVWCTGRETKDLSAIEAPFGLAAYGEAVVLANKSGKILDVYEYARAETDVSYARVPDGTGAFQTTSQPTPGYANTGAGLAAFNATLSFGMSDVILSEAMNANYSYLKQPDTKCYDWIELYNKSGQAVNLRGYALSDNAKNPAKWVFPDITLNAGEYMVVLASGKNVTDTQKKNLETNFGLSGDGESIFLFSPEGNLLDKLQIGRTPADVSYGRTGTQLMYYSEPTPGAANTGGLAGYSESPSFTLASGVYAGAQQVSINVPANAEVTYTLDGSEPSQSSIVYRGAITVANTTVIRARAYQSGLYGSEIATASYIIDTGANTMDAHTHSLPVMSVVTDPKNLWDPATGIYVLGTKFGDASGEDPSGITMEGGIGHKHATKANFWQQWERPVHFDLIDASGVSEYSGDGCVRIFGAFSRAKEQKALALLARAGYGGTSFAHAFFANRPYTAYSSLVLRPSAQDSVNSKIRDIVVTSLLEDGDLGLAPESDIAVQAYRQMVVYLNGKYWGVYNLREKINKDFLCQHYGIGDPDTIDILMGNGNDKCVIANGSGHAWNDYTDMVKWAGSHDLSNAQNYAYICGLMDVENFAAYTAAEIVVGNTDTGNIKYWRSSATDNKWRWLFYDFCWAMNRNDNNGLGSTSGYRRDFYSKYFHETGHGASKATSTVLIRALLQNASFRQLFLEKTAILLNDVYTPEKILARVDECQKAIQSEMEFDAALWNEITFKSWQQHCDNIRDYARNFQPYSLKYVQAYFNLSDSEMMSIFGRVTTLTE